MIEVLLFSLFAGLFICGGVAIRVLTKQETTKMLSTFIEDREPEPKSITVRPVPEKVLALQDSTERFKD
ncbi:hypothetical protein [Tenuibacillus multivorans]|uniref:Uncharacterized protein n=1 Tax=Tenuibacillus multivorans TaxID=237069 RepID=A0A1G9WA43_9BACI|nr:hypothetical protein [Tenuibacillus multivorans]GEL76370.1 hypothetical protein TMU01_06050 [Tenuibacillus multivorans]SDM81370.1 hypothetical protein SAMN05216498_0662 [Tenuibacillus multivorans]